MPEILPVSLILTTLNEESTLNEFFMSLCKGTHVPAEISVCDGGSSDRTVDILKTWRLPGVNIKLEIRPGFTIAQGRNEAIRHSSYEILAITDAGCLLHRDWFHFITKPLLEKADIDAVAGGYEVVGRRGFESVAAAATLPLDSQDKEGFLPSSRSFAIRKKIFWEGGGYPEHLYFAGEDTALCHRLKEQGKNFAVRWDARVTWFPRSSIKSFLRQYWLYGIGDGETGFNARRTFFLSLKWLAAVAILILGAYQPLWWGVGILALAVHFIHLWPKYKWGRHPVPVSLAAFGLINLIELAHTAGFIRGLIRRKMQKQS
ncbi:MAG: glycosyltransferase [Chlorobi bacterium]|nr:glycosyltransferase [Chlorobiota bacterium]